MRDSDFAFSDIAPVMVVWMNPGATAFTVTFRDPISSASGGATSGMAMASGARASVLSRRTRQFAAVYRAWNLEE